MKILVILAHPDKRSFSHAIAATCAKAPHPTPPDMRVHIRRFGRITVTYRRCAGPATIHRQPKPPAGDC